MSALGVVLVAILSLGSAIPLPPPTRGYTPQAAAHARGNAYELVGGWSHWQVADEVPGGVGVGVVPVIEWDSITAAACLEASGRWAPAGEGGCVNGVPEAAALDCAGEEWVEPRWRRYRVPPATEYSAWERVDYGSCGEQVLPVLTADDFRRLPLPVPAVHVQPDTGWVLVNKETIVYTDPTPATLTTQLLGRNVTVEATPVRYTYEWGDGSRPLETADPGSPYPDFDVFHVYEELGEVAITVTTEWSGRYQVEGDPQWREVAGTATTSATGPVFEVQERRSRLVSGRCTDEPAPADC